VAFQLLLEELASLLMTFMLLCASLLGLTCTSIPTCLCPTAEADWADAACGGDMPACVAVGPVEAAAAGTLCRCRRGGAASVLWHAFGNAG